MSREVIRDALIYLPAKIVPATIGLISIPILTHFLAPEQYGQYLLALTTLTLISSFCASWLTSITIRFNILYGVNELHLHLKYTLIIALFAGCIIWLIVSDILSKPFNKATFLLAGVGWLICQGYYEYYLGWLRARGFAKKYSIAVSWRSIIGLVLAVFMLQIGYTDGNIVIIMITFSMLIGLTILPKAALNCPTTPSSPKQNVLAKKEILKYGIPAAFINLITLSLSLVDRYFINSILGTESVAIYSASYDIAEKTIFFINSILLLSSSVIGFRIFEEKGELRACEFLTKLMRLYLVAAPPLAAALVVMSPHIVKQLLPSSYESGAEILPIVAVSGLFVGILHRYSLLLSFHKRTDLIMWCSFIALTVNLTSCWILIPTYGLIGAAISTLITYVAWLMLVRFASTNFLNPPFPWKTLFRVLVAAIMFFLTYEILCHYLKPDNLLLHLIFTTIGFTTYTMTLLALKEFNKSELQSIFTLNRSINQ